MVPQVTVVENLTGSENKLSLKTGYAVANCHSHGSLLLQGAHQHTQHTLHDLNCSLFLLPSRELICQKFVGVAASAMSLHKLCWPWIICNSVKSSKRRSPALTDSAVL